MSESENILEATETVASVKCRDCGFPLRDWSDYHPFSFCVLVREGFDPEFVVGSAVRYYEQHGWPEGFDTETAQQSTPPAFFGGIPGGGV